MSWKLPVQCCFDAMERATWTRGGGEKCADPVDWSLLPNGSESFSGQEVQAGVDG